MNASELVEDIVRFHSDPLGFVRYAFPWGEPGELEKSKGPREWQVSVLKEIGERLRAGASAREAIQIAVASGHGIGKSALVSWVIIWAVSTFEDTRGVVTANTDGQLRTKTWPELAKWHRLAINSHWFKCEATALFARQGHEKNWRIDAVPWSENNTEAFAGLHNVGKRILVVFDEASGIPPPIWEVTEGALTDADTQIIWLAFGNPTKTTGRFHDAFGRLRHRWSTRQIDSRTVEGTNKAQLQAWVDDYGEDSDFVRTRVRGVFPRASASQFIPRDIVDGAMRREGLDTPNYVGRTAAVGVDVARFGSAQSVIATRIGRDARSFPAKKYRGLDTVQLANRVGEHVSYLRSLGLQVVLFIDGGGVGGGVVDNLRRLEYDPIEVNFGSKPTDSRKYGNKRAEMWGELRDWLELGQIEASEDLASELTGPEYFFNKTDQIILQPKEEMDVSPDWADALALTRAQPVPEYQAPLEGASGARTADARRHYDPLERMGRS